MHFYGHSDHSLRALRTLHWSILQCRPPRKRRIHLCSSNALHTCTLSECLRMVQRCQGWGVAMTYFSPHHLRSPGGQLASSTAHVCHPTWPRQQGSPELLATGNSSCIAHPVSLPVDSTFSVFISPSEVVIVSQFARTRLPCSWLPGLASCLSLPHMLPCTPLFLL